MQKDFNERLPATAGGLPPGTKSQATAFDPRDLVPEPIFCCDADGRFVWVNHAAEKLTGYVTVQLLGQPFSMLIAPSKRRRLVSFFVLRHRRDQEESERDVPILTREGRTVWVGVRVRRVRTLHGRIGFVACAHDLHNIVFEIERLRRESRDLEARATEAAGAARFKGEFLAAMSQEIRAPMDGVLGMTRLLLESNLDRDQRTFAEVIQSSGEQLLRLVNDILEFSRIEAGKLEIANLDFDVRVTLDGVGASLHAARTKGISFSRSVHHDVPSHLQGDPGRLRQVLNQIVSRLVDCMDKGEISIWATLTEETPHDVTLRFSVSYAGHTPSVDLEELAQVFGSTPGKSRRMDAEALGMAISRQLVVLMGGKTGVETQARGGSIWFQMPFKRTDVDAPIPVPLEVELTGLSVLVADPSVGMRMAICEMLATWGCVPVEAEEGEYALGLLRDAAEQGSPYRVVIVDMNLPTLDGRALARAIRADQALAGTLLMALTAVGRRGDASAAQEMGFSAYLLKPFEPAHLHDALVEVVHRGLPSLEAQIDGPVQSIVTRHSVAEARRQRLRILVVEDNPVNQLVAVAALRRAGYRPQTAASASEAIQDHALNPFDLIFMDLELPDLDGIEATAEIRRMEEGRPSRTPIVALTGHDQPEVHRRCLAVGMKEVLVKPLDLDALCAGIDRWTQPDTVRLPLEDLAPPSAPAVPEEESSPPVSPAARIVAAHATVAPVERPAPSPAPAPAFDATSGGDLAGGEESELLTTWDGARAVEGSEMGGLPVVDLSRMPVPPIAAPDPGVVHLPAPAEMSAASPEILPPAPPAAAPTGALLDASNALAAADAQTLSASAPRILEMRPAPASYESTEPVLDEARLESSCMGNHELKNILIRTFLHHIRPRLRRLRDVADAQDAKAVEFEAHGLKGMSATIGAACCAEAFARIERFGREKRLEPVAAMLDYAEVEVGRVEAAIGARKAAA